MNPTLQDILNDIHAAERELQKYEKRYRLRSDFFYDCYGTGLTDNGNADLQIWAGLFESKCDLERRFKTFLFLQNPLREGVKALLIANGIDID